MSKQAYSKDEIARRGDAIYEARVRPNVDEEADRGAFVAIDVETGDWEASADSLEAMDRLEERRPGAEVWLTRIGLGYVAKFGGRPRKPEAS